MEPETNTPAPAPFDATALAKQVTEAAVAAATQVAEKRASEHAAFKLQQAADVLTGRPQVDPTEQILKGFVADPVKAFKTVKDVAKQEIYAEMDKKKNTEDMQRSVVMPFIDQYPELKGDAKLALVEKLTEKHEKAGLSYSEALKKGCEETVKEFGLKPVSEAQRQSAALYAGLPGGGGMGSGAPARDEGQAQTDFISSLKAKSLSFRNKK